MARMKELRSPSPGTLLFGFIFTDTPTMRRALEGLVGRYGPVALESPARPFCETNYYNAEMGQGLKRKFLTFKRLVPQDSLVDVKLASRDMETALSEGGRRRINIDPGILTLERLVLASSKDFAHRVYLGRGVFADLTLIFQGGHFRCLPWTYPDYSRDDALLFWERARAIHLSRLRRQRRNRSQGRC